MPLRRWAFSAAFVVAAHGAVVLAALTWWELTWRESVAVLTEPDASLAANPFLIDLPPLAGGLTAKQGGFESESTASGVESLPTPSQIIANAPAGESIERGQEPVAGNAVESDRRGPQFAKAPVEAAGAVPPAQSADAETSASTITATGGRVPVREMPTNGRGISSAESHPSGTVDTIRIDPGPIDTSITVPFGLHSRKSANIFDRNKMILSRSSRQPGERTSTPNASPGRSSGASEHGAHVQDRAKHPMAKATLPTERDDNAIARTSVPSIPGTGRNAIGGTVAKVTVETVKNALGSAIAATSNVGSIGARNTGTTVNAIGMTILVPSSIHQMNNEAKTKGLSVSSVAAMPIGSISGRDVSRPALAPGIIGGPAKMLPGVLNGTSFRSRASTFVH